MRLFLFPAVLALAACSGDKPTDPIDTALDSGVDTAADPDSGTDTANDTDSGSDSGQAEDADGDGAAADVDCDDTDAAAFPGNPEICDERDNDCNGLVDDDASDVVTYYADADRDGYGDGAVAVESCVQPPDTVTVAGDCNDADAAFRPGADEADCADPNDYNCDGSVGYADADADGIAACAECDDANDAVFPGAPETCNGIDDDCNGTPDDDSALDAVTWYADADGDGHGDVAATWTACEAPTGYTADADDCDDASAARAPGLAEVCDGLDNDCNAAIDDEATDAVTSYTDADGDGYGAAATATATCEVPESNVLDATDCDDAAADTHPDADETCGGGDENCDGAVDEATAVDAPIWYADADGDGFGDEEMPVAACSESAGTVADSSDCDDAAANTNPDADEFCGGGDENCDGAIDEDSAVDAGSWYADLDGDSFTTLDSTMACEVPAGFADESAALDCDDSDPLTRPFADEVCGGGDENCDGTVDEATAVDAVTWYADTDEDGFTTLDSTMACDAPFGFTAPSIAADCDDADALTNPSGAEVCGGGDENCDGAVDEATASDASTWYADTDGDAFGDPSASLAACSAPGGYVADATDCNDADTLTNPAGTELCGGADENCDGAIDENSAADASTWYADADGDAFGDVSVWLAACLAPSAYVADDSDCDDAASSTNPAANEVCGGADENCDGTVDEDSAVDALTWYADTDADGFGNASALSMACEQPAATVADASDCDDARASVYPGAPETCDAIDNDCDTLADDADTDRVGGTAWYADADADGYTTSITVTTCVAPSGYRAASALPDCDDDSYTTNPAADEQCGGGDENCDGTVDEASAIDALLWYADDDDDGFGNASVVSLACEAPVATVSDATDCDDAQPTMYPGALETCDSLDNDCDALVDDADAGRVGGAVWYADADGDGYTTSTTTTACVLPLGYAAVLTALDCDDTRTQVYPGASETCDSLDNDCDSLIDTHDPNVVVAAAETCDNGIDDNCNDSTDSCEIPTTARTGAALAAATDSPPHVTSRAGASWYGTLASDGVGNGLANVGDMNGDGRDDVFLSAYQFDTSAGTDVGRAWLWSGTAASGNTTLTTSTSSTGILATISGVRRNTSADYLGMQIGGAGNFGGTDTLAVIVGASNTRTGTSSSALGAAGEALVFVNPTGALDRTSTAARLRVQGTVSTDYVGFDVSGGQDVNGDGLADVVVGGYGYDVSGLGTANSGGAAGVFFGGTSGDVNFPSASAFFTGAAASDQAGQIVAMVPDLNGDGLGEVVVCAYKADTVYTPPVGVPATVTDGGKAYVIYGDAAFSGGSLGSSAVVDVTISGPTSGTYTSTYPEFCRSVGEGGGDYNGDGNDDLWIGAHQVTTTVGAATYNYAGAAYLFTGSSSGLGASAMSVADARTTLVGTEASMFLGRSVATGGDFNGDGMDDVVVGASSYDTPASNAGAAFGWYGGLSTGTWSVASADFVLTGERASDAFGGSVAFAGDTDGDGFDDLLLSAVNWEPSGSAVTSVGNVWMIRGRGE